ncbi:C45 family peptidase [Micromonospora sp. CPCC 206061]|uniref:C45 family peptidase n=1 Tax=Micromonospora sp. CPCC 206061 TaxID=3122410 RepID=UPI002FEF3476
MELTFRAVDVGDGRDGRWLKVAEPVWPVIVAETEPAALEPAGEAAARELFAAHMPELVPVLDGLAAELDRPGAAGVLTQAALKPFFSGCSMAGAPGALVRNYDFNPEHCERTVVASRFLRPVIGMGDFLWGLLDGMNDAGLAVALSFGGRFTHGRGMSILLVVRHLLETCASVDEAWRAVAGMPVSTSQNLILVDREQTAVVHLGPDRRAVRVDEACVTNHQDAPVPDAEEASNATQRRLAALRAMTNPTADALVAAMLRPPLYQTRYAEGAGTVYTADYRPAQGRVTYVWPDHRHEQSFAGFAPGEWTVRAG